MTRFVRVAGCGLLLVLLALLCLRDAADRLAGQGYLVAAPDLLLTGGNALTLRAWRASEAGDDRAALTLSRAALRLRPADAATLRTAGIAAIRAGEPRCGDALMRLAGAAGWRDMPTQLYWAQIALRDGAWDVAAERLDAVRRVNQPDGGLGRALFRRLERGPPGRLALARRLAVPGSGWIVDELADLRGLDAAGVAARDAMATLAARVGLARDDLNRVGQGLIDGGRADLAARLLRVDPRVLGFMPATPDRRQGPFDWVVAGAIGLDAEVARWRGQAALHVIASGATLMPLAARLTVLPAGTWRLSIAVAGARTAQPLIVAVACLGGGVATAEPVGAGPAWIVRVPPIGCATQRLGLAVSGEEVRRGADLWIGAPEVSGAARVP